MIANSASWVLDTSCGAHIYNDLQVMTRNKRLSKGEVDMRLGNGKRVAAEAVGLVHLVVSDHNGSSRLLGTLINGLYNVPRHNTIMNVQNKCKSDNQENSQIWHVKLGHISQDRIRKLVDSKSLEIDDLDNLSAYESCLKGKMTKKPFVRQSMLASDLLDLILSDVYEPFNTQARGGLTYFITFTDAHSQYGCVYLMKCKSEAFEKFKEFRHEVEDQTDRKIKTLRSDRGGEYLSGEFLNYLKENEIISQWTPPGVPQLNSVSERRNRTLLDMVRSMMNFTELPLSF
ncbi:UNVERIFIED_CONTAM: hypothetical protein Slati_2375100 [Sesamum latifolium]|uniref:Integrase catalytic domain-containing protein n=1 Tax=Sesamum latifolium TaxID=2727402 RepID=A0AAW2WCB0_9LAMI